MRIIGLEERIPMPRDTDTQNFLSLDDQRDGVNLELLQPLQVEHEKEPFSQLTVRAPTTRAIRKFEMAGDNVNAGLDFYGGCVVGIPPRSIEKLHGKDYNRLTKLVSNFVV